MQLLRCTLLIGLAVLSGTPHLAAAGGEVSVFVKGPRDELVADAVIALLPIDGAPVPATTAKPEIMQEDQQFAPYVTIVQAGTAVVFPNRDNVQHHVYSVSKTKRFELPLYEPGKAEVVTFDEPGVVALGCNIHDWMVAYLVVVPTPWFAKTGIEGTARVSAPAGRYRLQLWHPRMDEPVFQEITVAADAESPRLEFAVKLKPAFKIRRAPDSKRSGYR